MTCRRKKTRKLQKLCFHCISSQRETENRKTELLIGTQWEKIVIFTLPFCLAIPNCHLMKVGKVWLDCKALWLSRFPSPWCLQARHVPQVYTLKNIFTVVAWFQGMSERASELFRAENGRVRLLRWGSLLSATPFTSTSSLLLWQQSKEAGKRNKEFN